MWPTCGSIYVPYMLLCMGQTWYRTWPICGTCIAAYYGPYMISHTSYIWNHIRTIDGNRGQNLGSRRASRSRGSCWWTSCWTSNQAKNHRARFTEPSRPKVHEPPLQKLGGILSLKLYCIYIYIYIYIYTYTYLCIINLFIYEIGIL